MVKKIKKLVKCLLCGTRYDSYLHKACPSCMKISSSASAQLRAAVAEAICRLSPEGCRLMNAAYSSVCEGKSGD